MAMAAAIVPIRQRPEAIGILGSGPTALNRSLEIGAPAKKRLEHTRKAKGQGPIIKFLPGGRPGTSAQVLMKHQSQSVNRL